MKQQKHISKTVEKYEGDWPPEDLEGFTAWFQAKLSEIPEAHRSEARIYLDSTTAYDSSYATIEISYSRPETDEEEAQREQQAAARIARQQAD